MSIDYRDQICNRPLDVDGYELPPWLNPFLCDYDADLAKQADIAWLNENPTLPPISGGSLEPSDADWDDYARWSEWADRNDEIRRQEDAMDELCRRYAL